MNALRRWLDRRREEARRRRRWASMVYGLAWCDCGAPMAQDNKNRRWDCSDIILGVAIPKGEPGSMRHSDAMPYVFWKVRRAVPNVAVRREPRNQGDADS